jgi:hypothetical protein
MALEVRPTRIEDFLALAGRAPPVRVKAYTAVDDGAVVALGGVAFCGNGVFRAFFEVRDEETRRRYPVALFKTALRVLAEVKAMGVPQVVACPQDGVDAAERFLLRLGFRPVDGAGFYAHE